MNKKLLLILSILMSLSMFTMSCAKSVTAPESTASYTQLDISQVVSSINTYGGIIKDGDVEIDLKNVRYSSSDYINITYTPTTTAAQPIVFNQNNILNAIAASLQSIHYYANGVSSIAVVSDWTRYEYTYQNVQYVYYQLKAQAVGKYGDKLDFYFILETSGNINWQ